MSVVPSSFKSIHADQESSSVQNCAVLLDRVGVINFDRGYVHHPKNFEFINGLFDLARVVHASGYKLLVITNQAGIARGYYSEKQFHQLTAWMCNEFLNAGVSIEKFISRRFIRCKAWVIIERKIFPENLVRGDPLGIA